MEHRRNFKLHRTSTYNYKSESQYAKHTYYYDGSAGKFTLTHDPKTDLMIMDTPDGRQIVDVLDNIREREYLYEKIDDGDLLQYLIQIKDEVRVSNLAAGIKESSFTINDVKYRLRIDPHEKTALLNISNQLREMSEELLYAEHLDIPAIQDGMLNTKLRMRLRNHGFKLPETPYDIGLQITPKLI